MLKSSLVAFLIIFFDIPFDFLPKVSLLVAMFGAMTLDFITGILKAYVLKQKITSKALRRTVIKFTQYGGAILIGLGISYMSKEVGTFNESWKYAPRFMSFFNNSLLVFIITIEVRSIVENITFMDKNSRFAKSLLSPVLRVFDIHIRNNPITRFTIETNEDVEIKEQTIQSKNVTK